MDKVKAKEALIKYLEENGLYMVQKSDFDHLINMAGKTYKDYPLCVFCSGGTYNEEDVKQTTSVNLYAMFNEGIIYSDSKELNGCVMLLPPGYTGIKTIPFVLNGGFKIIFRQGLKSISRMVNFESFAMGLRKKYTDYKDWYLYNIFVDENAKGKKIASKLVKPLINYFKLNKQMCYLETNSSHNVPIYEHFGFKVVEKCMVPNSNVEHYAMLFDGR